MSDEPLIGECKDHDEGHACDGVTFLALQPLQRRDIPSSNAMRLVLPFIELRNRRRSVEYSHLFFGFSDSGFSLSVKDQPLR